MRWNYHFDTPDNFTTEIFSKCLRNFTSYPRNVKGDMGKLLKRHWQSISSGQRNLMKTYHNEANHKNCIENFFGLFRTKEIELQNF